MKLRVVKQLLSALMVSVLVVGQFSGCKAKETSNEGKDNSQVSQKDEGKDDKKDDKKDTTSDGKKEKFVIALAQNSNVEDYETNYLTKMLEDKFNVDIDFMLLPATPADAKSKFSIMASSGSDLPDIIAMNFTAQEQVQYGEAGIFVPLNDYINDPKIAPYFNQIPEEDRKMFLQNTTMPDGNIYGLAAFNDEEHGSAPCLHYINQAWLKKLNLEVPKTTDDFYNVLKAFVTQDPNGNGKADEIGMTGLFGSNAALNNNTVIALMNAFIYYRGNGTLELNKEGKIYAPFTDEAFKEGLEYMHKLCADGLLSPSIFTQDNTQLKALLANDPQIVGSVVTLTDTLWGPKALETSANYAEMNIIPPLTGPKGVSTTPSQVRVPSATWFVTESCKNPQLAFQIGDYFYDFDVTISMRFGKEGENWSIDPEVSKDYSDPTTPNYEVKIAVIDHAWGKVQNVHWYAVGPRYMPRSRTNGYTLKTKEDRAKLHEMLAKQGKVPVIDSERAYYVGNSPKMAPVLIYKSEELEQIADIKTTINDYINQFVAEVITGAKDISEWDNYVDQLNKMGLQKWIEVDQGVYDRMK